MQVGNGGGRDRASQTHIPTAVASGLLGPLNPCFCIALLGGCVHPLVKTQAHSPLCLFPPACEPWVSSWVTPLFEGSSSALTVPMWVPPVPLLSAHSGHQTMENVFI